MTDFGLDDPYVGQMKAVLLRMAPAAPLFDLTHGVAPQRLEQAAFFLNASLPHLPDACVVLCVVDPGVGAERRIVCLQAEDRRILAPDNGLLSLVLDQVHICAAHDLTPTQGQQHGASNTFHGRDIFAPLAARLATGVSPHDLGPEMQPERLIRLQTARPREENGRLVTHVLSVDRFGNAILDLPAAIWAPRLTDRSLRVAGHPLRLVTTYADLDKGAVGILEGSQGMLELAANQASAARRLRLGIGDTVVIEKD